MTIEEEDEAKIAEMEAQFLHEAALVFLISDQGQAYAILNTADKTLFPVFAAKLRQMAAGLEKQIGTVVTRN